MRTVSLPPERLDGLLLAALAALNDALAVGPPYLECSGPRSSGEELDAGIVGEQTTVRLGVQLRLAQEL